MPIAIKLIKKIIFNSGLKQWNLRTRLYNVLMYIKKKLKICDWFNFKKKSRNFFFVKNIFSEFLINLNFRKKVIN